MVRRYPLFLQLFIVDSLSRQPVLIGCLCNDAVGRLMQILGWSLDVGSELRRFASCDTRHAGSSRSKLKNVNRITSDDVTHHIAVATTSCEMADAG